MRNERIRQFKKSDLLTKRLAPEVDKEIETLAIEAFQKFQKNILDDPRIGPSHISLYTGLLTLLLIQQKNPIIFFGREVMERSKIFGVATYHRTIRQLNEFGYIRYVPSYYHLAASRVYF